MTMTTTLRRIILFHALTLSCTFHQQVSGFAPKSPTKLQSRGLSRATKHFRQVNTLSAKHPNSFTESPLFTSSKAVPVHTKSRYRQLLFALPALLLAASFPSQAWAANTSIQQSIRSALPWKRVFRGALLLWTFSAVISNIRLKRRQAKNATCEWSRYAQHPLARGRAIMWLVMQQAVFILVSKILSRLRGSGSSSALDIRNYAGRHFADSLLKLGPLYIKLGQIVSCRKNLLGPEWIDAMATLQDKVPARSGQEALDLAYSTLEGGKQELEELFSEFDDTPLAAASLGQVHKAILRETGDVVAVKVQRPHLKTIYDQDLEFLTTIAQWMDKMPSQSKNVGGVASSWTKIFDDAEVILYREIDYRAEANNAIRFAEDFGLTLGGNPIPPTAKARNNQTLPSAADGIRTPYVYKNVSNERLLVMEFVPSIKITNTAKLDAANITASDKIDLADALARAYLRQFCCNLFFSTDPHPGNVGAEVLPDGTPRLVIYDFGQAASLNQDQADGILQIIEAIIDMDVDRSIEAFIKMGVLVDGADLDKVRAKVAENYRTGKVKANRKKLRRKGYKFKDDDDDDDDKGAAAAASKKNETPTQNTAALTAEVASKDSEVMSFFNLPAEYAFVARAISQMDGVGKGLDPDFDFISNSAPYIVEIKGADKYLKEEIVKFFSGLQSKIADLCNKHKKLLRNQSK
jgi:predicted unusual protein kinase regulating ubiquinone biosynthesis (AarF/ABC1/UbiB family)